MQTDESGAPWPYEHLDVDTREPGTPTWECPGGECECHPTTGESERVEHRILFFDQRAERMGGARCRVLENGRLLNKDSPYADGSGGVTVRVTKTTRSLLVEWAPEDVPEEPQYPFRALYHLVLGPSVARGVERRLHNIGFSGHGTLEDNVRDFQRTYVEDDDPSGDPHDVHATLMAFHDEAGLPPLGSKVPKEKGSDDVARSDFAGAKQGPGDKGKGDGDKGDGGGTVQQAPQGCVAPIVRPLLRVQLTRAFSLKHGDLTAPPDATPEALSDADKILDEYYDTDDKKTFRFPNAQAHRVQKANLTPFFGSAKQAVVQTDLDGIATVSLVGVTPNTTVKVVVLPPDENDLAKTPPAAGTKKKLQINETNKPAGPDLSDETTDIDYKYRPFLIEIDVDAQGLVKLGADCRPDPAHVRVSPATAPAPDSSTGDVDPEKVTALKPAAKGPKEPPFIKVIQLSTTTVQKGTVPLLVLDWRPDWIKGNKFNRYKDWNRFDKKITPPAAAPPPSIVLHQTHSVILYGGVVGTFRQGTKGKGIHYVVDLDGHAIKMADEHYATGHAGASQWQGNNAANYWGVGIEHVHSDTHPPGEDKTTFTPRDFPMEQREATARICKELMAAYGIRKEHVFGHRDGSVLDGRSEAVKKAGKYPPVYPNRLQGGKPDCPGVCFYWDFLEAQGVALQRTTTASVVDDMEENLSGDLYLSPPEKLNDPSDMTKKVVPPDFSDEKYEKTIALIKRMLQEVGYSVSKDDPPPDSTSHDGKLDGALLSAMQSFQAHWFASARRAYKYEIRGVDARNGRTATLASKPKAGHIDKETIVALIEMWWAKHTV